MEFEGLAYSVDGSSLWLRSVLEALAVELVFSAANSLAWALDTLGNYAGLWTRERETSKKWRQRSAYKFKSSKLRPTTIVPHLDGTWRRFCLNFFSNCDNEEGYQYHHLSKILAGALLKNVDALPGFAATKEKFPFEELHAKTSPDRENVDGSESEDDKDGDEVDDDANEQDGGEDAEDFSAEDGDDGDLEDELEASGNGKAGGNEEDDGEEDDDDDANDEDNDEDDEDFSAAEGDEGDQEDDPVVSGNGRTEGGEEDEDDDDDNDDDDDDDDDDGDDDDDEEEDEDEDEDEETLEPPAKRRK